MNNDSNDLKKKLLLVLSLFAISLIFLFLYDKFCTPGFLTFSDGAKFSLIAKNIIQGKGYGTDFTFYSTSLLTQPIASVFGASGVPVLISYTLSIFFRIFGIKDASVIMFSGFFYILTVVMTYFLGSKIFNRLTGFLSAITVAANLNYLDYGTSGASEPIYSFVTLLSTYLIFVRKKITSLMFFGSLILIYLTKPQGVVFIITLLFIWFIYNFSWKRGLIYFLLIISTIFFVDKLILYPLSFKYPVYPIVTRGIQAIFQYSPVTAVSDALRGQAAGVVNLTEVVKKAFYNLYNFYKLLPEIINPYLAGLFIISLFLWKDTKKESVFKVLTLLVTAGSLLMAALTIPFYRYIHPIVPFIYIVGVGMLINVISKFRIANNRVLVSVSTAIVFIFAVGQTLGVIFLDSRFERSIYNRGKPPVYVSLAKILKENTINSNVIITNLDTWGSWYGQRRTVWFPLEPKMLVNPVSGSIPFDAIYLTSYRMDDENYYMGKNWRTIFENPKNFSKWVCDGCNQIAKEFELKGVYQIPAQDNYERENASAILLTKKQVK